MFHQIEDPAHRLDRMVDQIGSGRVSVKLLKRTVGEVLMELYARRLDAIEAADWCPR